MNTFADYARYYDLLYRDKNYNAEAQFIHNLLQIYAPSTQSILELGCGTGVHAALLAGHGYEVYGVDLSAQMLEQANQRLLSLPPEEASKLQFQEGDIRTIRVDKKFDAVISLFHVFSYQITNQDLQAAFATARAHLKPGGVFIFDCWYGPAVISDPPTVRIKRLKDEKIAVTRIAEPVMHPNDNLVEVNYQVFIKDLLNGAVAELQETHQMRYLFQPEVKDFLIKNELTFITLGEWMTDSPPGFNTWNVYFIGKSK